MKGFNVPSIALNALQVFLTHAPPQPGQGTKRVWKLWGCRARQWSQSLHLGGGTRGFPFSPAGCQASLRALTTLPDSCIQGWGVGGEKDAPRARRWALNAILSLISCANFDESIFLGKAGQKSITPCPFISSLLILNKYYSSQWEAS